MDLAHQLEAVDAGHPDVGQHQVHRRAGYDLQGFRRIPGGRYVVAGARQDALEGAAVELLVVGDEDVRLGQIGDLRQAEGGP